MSKTYSIHKSRTILHHAFSQLKRRKDSLSPATAQQIETQLKNLEKAILLKQKEEASALAHKVEDQIGTVFKKSYFVYALEIIVAIFFALLIATVVRQMWFELYEIPTGSMRPSFKEQDRLTVTKTAFGLNVPLETKHFYFDPDLVERGKAIIFSGSQIGDLDEETKYFGILPYTKRYIKRLIGKPGDILYFYGGRIYGIDKDGNPLDVLLNDPWMQKIEHIPFITFEGEVSVVPESQKVLYSHFDQPIGKLSFNRLGAVKGEINDRGEWKKEQLSRAENSPGIARFGDHWGIRNYALAALLTRTELEKIPNLKPSSLPEAPLYLYLKHSPNLSYPSPRLYHQGRYIGAKIPVFESVLPLESEHIARIKDHLYTARFVVKDGKAKRYSAEGSSFFPENAGYSDVPDGTYELYNGQAEKVGFSGWTSVLPADHPLQSESLKRIQELFNNGIEMMPLQGPYNTIQDAVTHRYAYYRNGDLYLLGTPVLKKDDPALVRFTSQEREREKAATAQSPYLPFLDPGAPVKEGKLDVEFIKRYGLKIPDKHYLVLGDNHAMSKDSRIFGFVPEDNLQGVPSLIIWPPGERWGLPPQTPYPFLSASRLIVWGTAASILLAWYIIQRRRLSKRLFPDD